MSHRELDISVVMCAYTEQRWDAMCAAVESIRRQSQPPRELILVIDHNPKLLERTRAHFPDVTVLENREAQGLSGARNSGIAVAKGEIIAFIDEDALAAPDWLASLNAGYADPQVVGVGGLIEPVWLGGRPAWFPPEFDWVVGCSYTGMPQAPSPVRNLIGCNMSLRREVFEHVGGFRSGIGRIGTRPVGCEETELCIRVRQRWPERTMLYLPQARVLHQVTQNRGRWNYFYSRCYAEGLSKALVAQLVGTRDGLASERTYTLQTLPRATARGFVDALRGDTGGPLRSTAIVTGLALTTAGYLRGRLSTALSALRAGKTSVVQSSTGL